MASLCASGNLNCPRQHAGYRNFAGSTPEDHSRKSSLIGGLTSVIRRGDNALWGIYRGHDNLRYVSSFYRFTVLVRPTLHQKRNAASSIKAGGTCFAALHHAEWTHAVPHSHFSERDFCPHRRGRRHAELETRSSQRPLAQVDLPGSVWDTWAELARRHGPRLGIRTLDSLQVPPPREFGAKFLDLR